MSTAALNAVSTASSPNITCKSWLTGLSLFVADVSAILIVMTLMVMVFFVQGWPELWKEFVLAETSMLLVFAGFGLYPGCGISPAQEFKNVLAGSALSHGLAAGAILIRHSNPWRIDAALCFAFAATAILVVICRSTARQVCSGRYWWGMPTVIFGSGQTARATLHYTRANPSIGLRVVAIFEDDLAVWPELQQSGIPIERRLYAADFALNHGVSHAIVALSDAPRSETRSLIRSDARFFKHLLVIPDITGISSLWVGTRDLGGLLGLRVSQRLMLRWPRILKRACDLFLAGLACIVFLPVIVLAILAIGLTSSGPIIYGQVRVGRNNSRFTVWKFRSMCDKADEVLVMHLKTDPGMRLEWEQYHKLKNDPRITRVGRFLRRTSLDELPQLWNVLKGEMSMVGPRPIVAAEIARYGSAFDAYKSVQPGISGMWQISGRNNTSYGERVQFDEFYVTNWSIWLDLYIIFRTVKTVLLREGAY